jgi:hypothetical protein
VAVGKRQCRWGSDKQPNPIPPIVSLLPMRQSRSGGSVPVLVRDLRERCLGFHLRPDRYLLQSCDLFKSQMWHCTTSYQIGHFGHMNTTDLASAVNEIGEACDPQRPPRFFFLVGAGISAPSIPLASEITAQCRALAETRGRGAQPRGTNAMDAYSHWFERAFPQPAQRQEYLRAV